MKSEVKRLIKLLLISAIISFLLSTKVSTFSRIFVYFLSLLVLPDFLRNSNINWGKKLILIVFVGVISMATIKYFYGTGRILHNYIIVFCVVMLSLIVVNCIKRISKG